MSAGIVKGVGEALHLPTGLGSKTPLEHLQINGLHATVDATLSMVVEGEEPGDALEKGLKGTFAGTLGGIVANQIGEAYKEKKTLWTPSCTKSPMECLGE